MQVEEGPCTLLSTPNKQNDNVDQESTCIPQQAEADFDKISGPRNKKYPGLISMSQGFEKCIA